MSGGAGAIVTVRALLVALPSVSDVIAVRESLAMAQGESPARWPKNRSKKKGPFTRAVRRARLKRIRLLLLT